MDAELSRSNAGHSRLARGWRVDRGRKPRRAVAPGAGRRVAGMDRFEAREQGGRWGRRSGAYRADRSCLKRVLLPRRSNGGEPPSHVGRTISASGPTEGGGALALAAIQHRLAGGYGNQPSAVR